jgi:hypothetical protein
VSLNVSPIALGLACFFFFCCSFFLFCLNRCKRFLVKIELLLSLIDGKTRLFTDLLKIDYLILNFKFLIIVLCQVFRSSSSSDGGIGYICVGHV